MSLIRSRERVALHGEVFTPAWLVREMVELADAGGVVIGGRVLETACGAAPFLLEVAERKLQAIDPHAPLASRRSAALSALAALYGVEALEDNVREARARLVRSFAASLSLGAGDPLLRLAREIVHANVVRGDARSMRTEDGEPMLFTRWGAFDGERAEVERAERTRVEAAGLFDVVIGNPPYQARAAGGTRDVPIYQHFVEQAKALAPRRIVMVIPSRWMASGLGLRAFRQRMLGDPRISVLVDHPAASEVFPGLEIKAGVCVFVWDRAHEGPAEVTTRLRGEVRGPVLRVLGEHDVFVRDAEALAILRKVRARGEPSIQSILARDKEFGWTSNFDGFRARPRQGDVPIHFIRRMKRGVGYLPRGDVRKSAHQIDTWKVLVPQAYNGGDGLPHRVLGRPIVAAPPSVCTQSFLFFVAPSERAARSIRSYYETRFFRFLVSLRKITQHATHATYAWVPTQPWTRLHTDEALYEKYGLTRDEQAFIRSRVRATEPTELCDDDARSA